MKNICYWCGNAATSREHVPPKCLFPTEKDSGDGKSYRADLITVPSCEKHNGEKSDDDEHLLYILTTSVTNNGLGKSYFKSKTVQKIKEKPHLASKFFEDPKQVKIKDTHTDTFSNGASFRIDDVRLTQSFEHIARGLYFHHFCKIWPKKITVLCEFLMSINDTDLEKSREINSEYNVIRQGADSLFHNLPKYGTNPSVFYYQLIDEQPSAVMRLTFYEGTKVSIVFRNE